jgi:uncharacterized protein (TIGR00369 family)
VFLTPALNKIRKRIMDMATNAKDQTDNPTRRFVAGAVAAGEKNVLLDVNPAFASLRTTLLEGIPGRLSVGFEAPETTVQGGGVVSGGTLANMLDCAIAVAVLSLLGEGQSCATVTLSVNMIRGGKVGGFRAEANVDQIGRRMAFARADLFDADDRLVANATSALMVV